jgi:hypothetical protein
VWFIAYRHPLRPGKAGVKFVQDEAASVSHGESLQALGYVLTNVAPTTQARMDAFLPGTLTDPEQPPLG